MDVNWLSGYTGNARLDVLAKALTLAINQYFSENYICQEVQVFLEKRHDGRDAVRIERID